MTLEKLLEKLERQKEGLELAIEAIKNIRNSSTEKEKRKAIIKHTKNRRLHWTQTPEGKRRLAEIKKSRRETK